MSNQRHIKWEKIKPVINNFTVWHGCPEIAWFQKAWNGIQKAGLADYTNEEERHWVIIRGITLGLMYNEFCQLAWDEYTDDESLIAELQWKHSLSLFRLGNMVDKNFKVTEADDSQLFFHAISELEGTRRLEVYDAICAEFENSAMLFVGLWISREEGNNQNMIKSLAEEILEDTDTDPNKIEAFGYVISGMIAVDA